MNADEQALDRLLGGRWSCRAFEERDVPMETIERMLKIAQQAPSWCNTQPWKVIITRGLGTVRFRSALIKHSLNYGDSSSSDFRMPEGYSGVYRERRRESGLQLYEAVGIARGDREAGSLQRFKNYELFGAPHVAIVTSAAEQADYGVLDSGIYVGALLLAAQALGLGAIPQASLAKFAPFLRDYFNIPEDQRVLLAISFGYPDPHHPVNHYKTNRADVADVYTTVAH